MTDHADYAALDHAITLEELGRDLYEALASLAGNSRLGGLCRELAAAEGRHSRALHDLRRDLSARGRCVQFSDAEAAEVRQALKETVIPDRAAMIRAIENGSEVDIVRSSITLERNAISYFRSLSSDPEAGSLLQELAEEELGHLIALEGLADHMVAEAGRPL